MIGHQPKNLPPASYYREQSLEASMIAADKAFQRLLALAYMRGEFPKDCYPDGKVPLILTGG